MVSAFAHGGGLAHQLCDDVSRHRAMAASDARGTGRKEQRMATATCPECDADIQVDNVEVGEILPCSDCGADLEVTSVDPVELALAPEEGEDWGE